MRRLTNVYYQRRRKNYMLSSSEKERSAEIKLGQLEDIEDYLGISLLTLFKALRLGVYVGDEKERIEIDSLKYYAKILYLKNGKELKIEDYGRTWKI